jgi:hypothetical protein
VRKLDPADKIRQNTHHDNGPDPTRLALTNLHMPLDASSTAIPVRVDGSPQIRLELSPCLFSSLKSLKALPFFEYGV